MTWELFKQSYLYLASLGMALDTSRVDFDAAFFKNMEAPMARAFAAMEALEKGAVANPDENRQVGHYWLRNAALAPTPEIREAIVSNLKKIHTFVADVHSGKIRGSKGPFKHVVCIGIGGSALGPMFVSQALGEVQKDKLKVHFIDNTDPDGFAAVWGEIGEAIGETLVLVISKSGSTPEPRNAMLDAERVYRLHGLNFGLHAVAITGENSKLDKYAQSNGWLARFPMWDWVGGRTSEMAAVGLLPAALQGLDIDGMLDGAREMDSLTRQPQVTQNPAAMLALAWYKLSDGKGAKDMVVLPYRDALALFPRYLQQLIMESLGKEKSLDGKIVEQGLTVYGNKGSTDQHAYIQQLRDGVPNFFVTFIEVLKNHRYVEVAEGITAGDYLEGFLLGTRDALYEKNRKSITLTLNDLTPQTLGALIALYERAVGLYASLINVNAYHQPGVEAGKKAAEGVLALKGQILTALTHAMPAEELAAKMNSSEKTELVFKLLEHMAANGVVRGDGCGVLKKYSKAQ